MKRLVLFIAVLIGIASFAKANSVDVETAKSIGAKFLQASTALKNIEVNSLELVTTYKTNTGNEAFYVFNTKGGFVIVAADDCVRPILGYSTESQFVTDNIPIQLIEYLDGFVDEIQYGIENETYKDKTTIRQWELVKTTGKTNENRDAKAVASLLGGITWNQQPLYNNLCPTKNNQHAVTGCVATAMGQIMKYWGYPEHGSGQHSYTPSGYPVQSVDFSATTYDWTNMPDALTNGSTDEEINAVATLLYHCGVSVDMAYGTSESGANSNVVPAALQTYFGYSDEMSYTYREYSTYAAWLTRVKASIDKSCPVYYTGHNASGTSGHAFVCDGYDSSDNLHFNWGWGGNHNGYFPVNALNPTSARDYNYINLGIFNIHPTSSTPTQHNITVTCDDASHGTVTGSGNYDNGSTATVTATANTGYTFGYWTADDMIVSDQSTYEFTVEYSQTLVAHFIENTSTLCDIVFDLQDTFGDGWQWNYLVVQYDYSGLTEFMALDSGHHGSFTRKIEDGTSIHLSWIEGYFYNENQFFIKKNNGRILYENTSPTPDFTYDFTFDDSAEGTVKYYFTGANDDLWNNSGNWVSSVIPDAESDVSIINNVRLNGNAKIKSLSMARFDTVFINSGCKLEVTGAITEARRALIVIEDGGQLTQNNSDIRAIMKKDVTQWVAATRYGWQAVSSPIKDVVFDSIIELRSSEYNVYRFDEATTMWENCESSDNAFSSFENGRGYLYRKDDDKALQFIGKLNVSNVEYQLSYTTAAGRFAGFQLIGNPFSHDIKKGAEIANTYLEPGFYTLQPDGTWESGTDNLTLISPCQAILVQAKDDVTNEKLVISNTVAKSAENDDYDYVSCHVSSSKHHDVTYAIFNDGKHGLNKIDHENDDIQKVYISHNDADYAVAEMSRETKEIDLRFKAQTMGSYTLTIDYQGDFAYIHLFDKLTGEDVDMLEEGSYSFVGSPSDSEARFVVRLSKDTVGPSTPSTGSGTGSGTFVYQNGNTVMVDGIGLLQVYDVQGRMVIRQEIVDNQTVDVSGLPRSVYIFKLTGDTVRTQKVVLQ